MLVAPTARAQFGINDDMGGPGMGPSQPQQAAPNAPETHAASGSGEDLGLLPTTEVTLPQEPLEVPPEVQKRIGSDTLAMPEPEGQSTYRWYGLYFEEQASNYQFRTVFPFWAERKLPQDRASLYGVMYYQRRSPQRSADVVFPFYWDVRTGENRTHVVGPLVWRRAPGKSDNWLAPLLFQGSRTDGAYLHIPPLLTFTQHTRTSGFNLVGPAYCKWKGGSSCSVQSATDMDAGLAPFYFYGRSPTSEYELIPPLLHYYRYQDIGEKSLNIWGPLVWRRTRERNAFHVLPLFYHLWGQDEDHLTLLPLFHYGHKGNKSLFVNPLYLTARGEKGERTFVTWGYARYRGRTELDMITPLYWDYRDPDIGKRTRIAFPLVYSSVSPRERNLALFPFWAHFDRFGIEKTTWVTPFFQHSHGLTGWQTNVHPLLYLGRTQNRSHTVVAPVFWDFASPRGRTTVGFPLYWRFDTGESVSQLALNTYYHERKLARGLDWQFHFFPAFAYGETPDGHWWKVLYGLAGYKRKGSLTKMYAGWIPFTLSGSEL